MAERLPPRAGIEPTMWFVAFKRSSPLWWVRLLALGRFKHVAAFGWLPDQRLWVFYEVGVDRSRIAVLPDGPDAEAEISALEQDACVLAFTPGPPAGLRWPIGFFCVPAIAHLVGLRATVFRPDALFAALIRAGGCVCGAMSDAAADPAVLGEAGVNGRDLGGAEWHGRSERGDPALGRGAGGACAPEGAC